MKFFSYESKFSQLLLKLCYACYLNLLWFVCSIPIVTIGASTTALYYAALKVVRDEDSHVSAAFFRGGRLYPLSPAADLLRHDGRYVDADPRDGHRGWRFVRDRA